MTYTQQLLLYYNTINFKNQIKNNYQYILLLIKQKKNLINYQRHLFLGLTFVFQRGYCFSNHTMIILSFWFSQFHVNYCKPNLLLWQMGWWGLMKSSLWLQGTGIYIYIYILISRAGINVVFSWLWNRNTNGCLIGMVGMGLKKFT